MNIKGNQFVESFYCCLGKIMWEYCGMLCNVDGLKKVCKMIKEFCEEFYKDVFIFGDVKDYNFELEKVYCVVDFMELGELMVVDVLDCQEFCGGYFCEEY